VSQVRDRPLLGILLMLGFCATAPVGDALAKLLGTRMEVGQMILVRFALQALLLTPLALVLGADLRLAPRAMGLTAARTLLHVAALGLMFLALRVLPLADAVAIVFVMPFIMLLLGGWLLRETVGPRRLAACAAGFAGTLMVIQPSFAAVGWAALLPIAVPIAVAVLFAFFMLVTRQIVREADPIALQAVSGMMATVVVMPGLLLGDRLGWPELGLAPLPASDWRLLLLMGAVGSSVHLLMTWSLRFAPTSTLAPMQYLEIPFATAAGYLVFGALPNGLAAAGIFVTIAAGLYVILRERRAAG
jgi:drug/metabolite transporter (DMT)-like permease